jgi:hypothetical protein
MGGSETVETVKVIDWSTPSERFFWPLSSGSPATTPPGPAGFVNGLPGAGRAEAPQMMSRLLLMEFGIIKTLSPPYLCNALIFYRMATRP